MNYLYFLYVLERIFVYCYALSFSKRDRQKPEYTENWATKLEIFGEIPRRVI